MADPPAGLPPDSDISMTVDSSRDLITYLSTEFVQSQSAFKQNLETTVSRLMHYDARGKDTELNKKMVAAAIERLHKIPTQSEETNTDLIKRLTDARDACIRKELLYSDRLVQVEQGLATQKAAVDAELTVAAAEKDAIIQAKDQAVREADTLRTALDARDSEVSALKANAGRDQRVEEELRNTIKEIERDRDTARSNLDVRNSESAQLQRRVDLLQFAAQGTANDAVNVARIEAKAEAKKEWDEIRATFDPALREERIHREDRERQDRDKYERCIAERAEANKDLDYLKMRNESLQKDLDKERADVDKRLEAQAAKCEQDCTARVKALGESFGETLTTQTQLMSNQTDSLEQHRQVLLNQVAQHARNENDQLRVWLEGTATPKLNDLGNSLQTQVVTAVTSELNQITAVRREMEATFDQLAEDARQARIDATFEGEFDRRYGIKLDDINETVNKLKNMAEEMRTQAETNAELREQAEQLQRDLDDQAMYIEQVQQLSDQLEQSKRDCDMSLKQLTEAYKSHDGTKKQLKDTEIQLHQTTAELNHVKNQLDTQTENLRNATRGADQLVESHDDMQQQLNEELLRHDNTRKLLTIANRNHEIMVRKLAICDIEHKAEIDAMTGRHGAEIVDLKRKWQFEISQEQIHNELKMAEVKRLHELNLAEVTKLHELDIMDMRRRHDHVIAELTRQHEAALEYWKRRAKDCEAKRKEDANRIESFMHPSRRQTAGSDQSLGSGGFGSTSTIGAPPTSQALTRQFSQASFQSTTSPFGQASDSRFPSTSSSAFAPTLARSLDQPTSHSAGQGIGRSLVSMSTPALSRFTTSSQSFGQPTARAAIQPSTDIPPQQNFEAPVEAPGQTLIQPSTEAVIVQASHESVLTQAQSSERAIGQSLTPIPYVPDFPRPHTALFRPPTLSVRQAVNEPSRQSFGHVQTLTPIRQSPSSSRRVSSIPQRSTSGGTFGSPSFASPTKASATRRVEPITSPTRSANRQQASLVSRRTSSIGGPMSASQSREAAGTRPRETSSKRPLQTDDVLSPSRTREKAARPSRDPADPESTDEPSAGSVSRKVTGETPPFPPAPGFGDVSEEDLERSSRAISAPAGRRTADSRVTGHRGREPIRGSSSRAPSTRPDSSASGRLHELSQGLRSVPRTIRRALQSPTEGPSILHRSNEPAQDLGDVTMTDPQSSTVQGLRKRAQRSIAALRPARSGSVSTSTEQGAPHQPHQSSIDPQTSTQQAFATHSSFAERDDGRQRILDAIHLPVGWTNELNRHITRHLARIGSAQTVYNRLNAASTCGQGRGGKISTLLFDPPGCAATVLNNEMQSIDQSGINHRCPACTNDGRTCWYVKQTKKLRRGQSLKRSVKSRKREKLEAFDVDEDGWRWDLGLRCPKPDDDDENPGLGGGRGGDDETQGGAGGVAV